MNINDSKEINTIRLAFRKGKSLVVFINERDNITEISVFIDTIRTMSSSLSFESTLDWEK